MGRRGEEVGRCEVRRGWEEKGRGQRVEQWGGWERGVVRGRGRR